MLGSDANGEDISDRTAARELRIHDLRRLKIDSWEKIEQLQKAYASVEVPGKQAQFEFLQHLIERRDAWFVEAGDVGLIYFTYIRPEFSAQAYALFWDKKLSADRRESIKTVLATAFERFALRRIGASTPAKNERMAATWEKCGFVHEGTIRRGAPDGDDLLLFGLLREEQAWPVVTIPTTSLV